MIKFAVKKWDKNREKLAEELWRDREDGYSYKELLQKVVSVVLNEGNKGRYSADKISQIDDGGYGGTLMFLIPENTYEPEEYEYLMTYVNSYVYYGIYDCYDVLQHYNDMEYKEQRGESKPGTRIKGYLSICRTLLRNMIKPYNSGWREDEEFETVRWEKTEEETIRDEKAVDEAQARYVNKEEEEQEKDNGLWDSEKWKDIDREAGRPRFAQSVNSLLAGGHERDREFQNIIREVLPQKEDFVTLSGKKPFSVEYEMKAAPDRERELLEKGESPAGIREHRALMEAVFDYMVRAWLLRKKSDCDSDTIQCYGLRLHHIPLVVQAREETEAGLNLVKEICGEEKAEELERQRRWCLENLFLYFPEHVSEEDKKKRVDDLLDSCFFLARLKRAGLTGRISREDLCELFGDWRQKIRSEDRREIAGFITEWMRYFPEENVKETKLILDIEAYTGMREYTGSLEEGGLYVFGDTLYLCSLENSSVWRWQEAARLLAFYLLNLCCLAEGLMDGDEGRCGFRPGGREGYHERIIRKIGICRVRFGEVEVCDLSGLDQRSLLDAAAKLARWNGKQIPEEIWESFLVGKRIYTSGLVRELRGLPYITRRELLRVIGETESLCGVYEKFAGISFRGRSLNLGLENGPDNCIINGIEGISAHTYRLGGLNLEDRLLEDNRLEGKFGRMRRRVELDRGELLEILTEQMPMKTMFHFKRGDEKYEWIEQGEETDISDEERRALERIKEQLSLFHSHLALIDEVVIVDNYFEPEEDLRGILVPSGRGLKSEVVWHNPPYMIFWSRKTVYMASECLTEERHTGALMRLYGEIDNHVR